MSDVEVTYKEPLTRKETARRLSALAAALAEDGKVDIELGATRMQVHVPGEVRCKVEVEIDGDEVEFEVELTWSTTAPGQAGPPAEHGEQETTEAADEPPTDGRHSGRRKAGAR
jgi:amphi-Trp domain-containing protein